MHKIVQVYLKKLLPTFLSSAILLSCSGAQSEELSESEAGFALASVSVPEERGGGGFGAAGHRRRARYLNAHALEQLRLHQALKQLRRPKPTEARRFYRSANEANLSFSIGDTRDGYVIGAKALPSPSLLLRQLPIPYERGLAYGTQALIDFLTDIARTVDKRHPGSILLLGNLGAREGGDIPYSVSHNAGRDADIAFYTERLGKTERIPQHLMKFDGSLTARDLEGNLYRFDLDRNATLVEAMLMHPKAELQFIFVSKPLRNALLARLKARGASQDLLDRFEQSVWPHASHADHFHIRLYCAPHEICAGCVDRSVIHPWHPDPELLRAQCGEQLLRRFKRAKGRADYAEQALSLQRLTLLNQASQLKAQLEAALVSPSLELREVAAQASASVPSSAPLLAKALDGEDVPTQRINLFKALSALANAESDRVFLRLIEGAGSQEEEAQRGLYAPEERALILAQLKARPQQAAFSALLRALDSVQSVAVDAHFVSDILKSLRFLSNQDLCAELGVTESLCVERYRAWYQAQDKPDRRLWLREGMAKAGYVLKQNNKDIVHWLNALDGPEHLSVNAQLELKRISSLPANTLAWSIEDARWYYTKYFKRHQKRYKIDLSDRDQRGRRLR